MADVPVHEMSREAARLLVVAAETGGVLTEAALREELGVGHDDLRSILEQLGEHGQAVEVTPGEWTGPSASAEPRPVEVDVPEEENGRPMIAAGEDRARPRPPGEWWEAAFMPTVRLTRAIAAALDPESLGKLVKAGIDDAGEDETFRMEVVP